MNTPTFHSSLAQHMTDFVSFKRMQGFDYSAQAKSLHFLDAFLCEQRYQETSLNRLIVEAYVSETAHLTPNTRYTRLSIVRVLSRHLHLFGPESYVLHHLPVQRPSLPRWFLYSPHDIASLLCHARTLRPARSLHPHCFHLLLGLLYVSGLRIGEALALNLGDLDTNRGLLFVRNGKFGKERYLALDQSTILVVQDYLCYRTAYLPSGENAPSSSINRGSDSPTVKPPEPSAAWLLNAELAPTHRNRLVSTIFATPMPATACSSGTTKVLT